MTSACYAGLEPPAPEWGAGKTQHEEKQDVSQPLSKRALHLGIAVLEKKTSHKNLPVNLRTEVLLMWQIDLFGHILFQLSLHMMHTWKSL